MAENATSDDQEVIPEEEAASTEQQPDERTATPPSDEIAEANNRALRAQAELENFRKRIRREMEEQQRYAALPVLRDLLIVVDDMQRAIAAAESSQDAAGLLEGVKLVDARLRSLLTQHGCQQIEAAGAPFDPSYHEAILQQPSDEHEPGTVMQVTQEGYQLHDRVIRPAQVIVSASSERQQQG